MSSRTPYTLLKKKLYLKKLTDFLKLHSFVLFYQLVQDKQPSMVVNKNKIFLLKVARLEKLTQIAMVMDQDLAKISGIGKANMGKTSQLREMVRKKLNLLCKAAPMGSTLLVGFNSLESAQAHIGKSSAYSVCLGAIYNLSYLSAKDLNRLCGLQPRLVWGQLLNTLNGNPRNLVTTIMSPGYLLGHCLEIQSIHNKNL